MRIINPVVPLALVLAAAGIGWITPPPAVLGTQASASPVAQPARPHPPARPAPRPKGRPFTVCRQDEALPDGAYEINNNNFAGMRECLTGTRGTPDFRVSVSGASSNSPGSDAYPDLFAGCSWNVCSPRSRLPGKVGALGSLKSTLSTAENADGIWGAGYDMFFDQRPIRDGQAQVESMIWLNSRNAYDPAGMGWPVVRLDGALWWAMSWETSNGHQHWRYVQFRKVDPATRVSDLQLGPFMDYLESRGWITPAWYLLNIEAGFEIWKGGTGLAVTNFSLNP